jgi:DNA-binding MarR family transcriptional regulator
MTQLMPKSALGFMLNDVSRLFRQALDKAAEDAGLDLSPGEIRTLAYVATYPGRRQIRLAELMGVEPMTLSSSLERLQRQRLVVSEADPTDRRAKVVRPTVRGTEVFDTLQPIAEGVYDRAIRALSPDQVRILQESLRTVLRNLGGVTGVEASASSRRPPA